jgi:hypothetical protein
MPNLTEICMEKIKKSSDILKSDFPPRSKSLQQESSKALIAQQPFLSAAMVVNKKRFNTEKFKNLFNLNIEKKLLYRKQMSIDENMLHDTSKYDYNKVLLKFSKSNLVIEDLNTNLLIIKLKYKRLLSFNNSMLNENYYYLAYNDEGNLEHKLNKVIIFHSTDSSLIDEIIKEMASNFMNLTNNPTIIINEISTYKRTCQYCPLQQFVQLCDYLNELLAMNKHEKIYLTLNRILDNINEKDFIRNLCEEFETNPDRELSLMNYNIDQLNQLLCSFVYKICYFKQLQHLHLKQQNTTTIDENFNILNFIYDINKSDKDKTNEETLGNMNNNYNSLKKKFDKNSQLLDTITSNKTIKSRKERLSLGNIYSKSSTINFDKKDLFNNNNYKNSTLKRNSSAFDGIDKSLHQNLLSASYFSNHFETLLTCLSPQQQELKQQLHTELTQYQSTPMYKNQSKRRSIFNKVVGSQNTSTENNFTPTSNVYATRRRSAVPLFEYDSNETYAYKRFKTREDVRQFWRKIISEQILLIKMDHENKKFKAKIVENIPRRRERQNMAFLYEEVESSESLFDISKSWQNIMINVNSKNNNNNSLLPTNTILVTSNDNFEKSLIDLNEELNETVDLEKIRKLLLKGVPQENRDNIWIWLSKQYIMRNHKQIQKNKKNLILKYDLSYSELLKDNTTHQHAIMIDLGRTFPLHPNFSQKFSVGQLALFNVLKAYSVLDPDVGYCQGLSFIVGILLVHCDNDEEKTFELLKHLLINLGLRKQFRPDMLALQKYMYIVTRLLYDYESDLYQHLEDNEVSAQLYCTSWFLTLFSSQFEMGFVARVFDFLFAEGPLIIFKIAMATFNIHQALLMHCDSFEVILNYLKITVPEMSLIQTEPILNKAFNYDIERDVDAYETEFYIFQEEVQTCNSANVGDENMKVFQLPPSVILNSNNSFITQKNDDRRGSIIQKNDERRPSAAPLTSRRASNISTITTRRSSVQPSFERRGSTIALMTNNNSQISQLENINIRLKERIEDLLEQLRIFQAGKNNQDDLVYKLQHENKQLKCKIETLELERLSLLNQLKNDDRD